ncbi:MAG: ATP-binding protein, partial [Halobaculum sp.]
ILFQRKPGWTGAADERRRKIREGKDGLIQWIITEIFGSPDSDTTRGLPSETGHQHPVREIGGRERIAEIDEKNAKRSFTVNIRALSLVTKDEGDRVRRELDALKPVFNTLSGQYYNLEAKPARRGLLRRRRARKHAQRVLNSRLVTGIERRKTKPNLVLDPDELANVAVVPPSTELTTAGSRATEAKPTTRTPLSLPPRKVLDAFTERGMEIGRGVSQDGTKTEPIRVPPEHLTRHLLIAAATGGGKSLALLNGVLSLHRQTSGPEFVITAKGGDLPVNYMRAHAKEYGVDDLEENVLYFPVPEVLPALAFFNIESELEDGVTREQAIQNKVEHYKEILKLVMGEENVEEAPASMNLLETLFKTMYDEEHGLENGHHREDVDYFTHDQFEQVITEFQKAGPPDPSPENAPKSSNPHVSRSLEEKLHSNPLTFSNVLGGVKNRTNKISKAHHLRRIFNSTEPKFDFEDILGEDKVVIFDLGDLRDEAAQLMTGLLLTMLYDALRRRDEETVDEMPDDYVANLIIEEAPSVALSDILDDFLSRGREFGLSVTLLAQFPEQMRESGDHQVYMDTLNNIHTSVVGNISVDAKMADALSNGYTDAEEFRDRLGSLPRGEWIASIPGRAFGDHPP